MLYKVPPRGKIVRRLGVNVFGNPKYSRLLSRKPNGPGKEPRGRSRNKTTDYGLQLLEKQKMRFTYGLSEKQFRNTYFKAKKKQGVPGENFIALLESRLDNVIFRLGWAVSRAQARQMVSHKHFQVNGVPVNIPSYILNQGDVITVCEKKNVQSMLREIIGNSSVPHAPWVETDNDSLRGVYASAPTLDAAQPPGDIQAVVEYYSR